MNELSRRLHKAIEDPTINAVRSSSKVFHPSSASIKLDSGQVIGTCLRQQYYRITESFITNKGQTDHKFSAMIGDQLHEFVVNLIKNNGYIMDLQFIAAEDSFYDPDNNIGGRIDIIAWDTKAKEVIGIDTKTVAEYKAGICISAPAPEHIMQCMIYLYVYNKQIPENMPKIKKWYIWYISRTENYAIKSKKHGSPLAMAWDCYITLDDIDGSVFVHTNDGIYHYKEYTIDKVLKRYKDLSFYLESNIIPPRDYELTFSEEKILGMYKTGTLTRKADIEKVEKWVKKGAISGNLGIEMGDGECGFCPYKDLCWNNNPTPIISNKFNLVQKDIPKINSKIPPLTSL